MGESHRLAAILSAAAAGHFPPADGGVDVLPPDGDGTRAVVAMTGHAFVLADVTAAALAAQLPDGVPGGLGGVFHPSVLRWIAGGDGGIGSIDVVLVARANGGGTAERTTAHDGHPRVRRAVAQRRDVAVFADADGVAIVGRGLVGRFELSVELFDVTAPSDGAGRRLIATGLAALPAGERCWAQVAAGNARSLRAFLASGFTPIGAEVLIT